METIKNLNTVALATWNLMSTENKIGKMQIWTEKKCADYEIDILLQRKLRGDVLADVMSYEGKDVA